MEPEDSMPHLQSQQTST